MKIENPHPPCFQPRHYGSSLRCLECFMDSHAFSSKDKAKAKQRQSPCSEAKAKPMQRKGQAKTISKTSQGQAKTLWSKLQSHWLFHHCNVFVVRCNRLVLRLPFFVDCIRVRFWFRRANSDPARKQPFNVSRKGPQASYKHFKWLQVKEEQFGNVCVPCRLVCVCVCEFVGLGVFV